MKNKKLERKIQNTCGSLLGITLTIIIYGLIAIFFTGFAVLAYFTIFK